ncbi:MAG TPA: hypothetical protein GX734_01985 [Clostridiaceae bacterium]|nr:hypothetical protein [Clostridiaceae bacterium]
MMKRKLFTIMVTILTTMLCASVLAACTKESKSDKEFWFSSYESKFIAYDDELDNIDDAGNYWNMTMKKDCTVTISVRANVDYYSTLSFYVNGERVSSLDEKDIFSGIYKDVKLTKGDRLTFHARWTNRAITNEEGFEIAVFSIKDDTGNYLINGIK